MVFLLPAVLIVVPFLLSAQSPSVPPVTNSVNSQPEDYKIYTEHPRLLANPRHLRLLRRERERKTVRWEQLQSFVVSKGEMPERGFAYALYYLASEDAAIGKLAIQWALGNVNDTRQLALIFDWCQPLLTAAQSKTLSAKLMQAIERESKLSTVESMRNRVFAAMALAEHVPDLPEKTLRSVFTAWWLPKMAPALRNSRTALDRKDGFPLVELMHVIRDNLNYDMRDNALVFFKDYPTHRVLTYYPATYPAADNFYHIPQYAGLGEPDIREAALSRATDLSLVAFDANALEHQFIQGWLIQDRFIMRSAFGAPYEFLWANPYQPGLSYHHLPLFYHDPKSGVLLLRSTWEEDGAWLSYQNGEVELFLDGKRSGLRPSSIKEALQIGDHMVTMGAPVMRWSLNLPSTTRYFIIGMKPEKRYEIEVDDEELREVRSDAGGILNLLFPASANVGVRLKETGR